MVSDAELAARVAATGDPAAFQVLVERHQAALRGFLLRLLAGDHASADDLAQDTFIAAYRKLPDLRTGAHLSTWLHSIAYRQFLQHLRKHRRQRVVAEPPDAGHDPRAAVDAEYLAPRLLAEVSPPERACLVLAYAAGMSHAEVAAVTDLPVGTVKSHITRGKQKLQNWLERHDHSLSDPSRPEVHRA